MFNNVLSNYIRFLMLTFDFPYLLKYWLLFKISSYALLLSFLNLPKLNYLWIIFKSNGLMRVLEKHLCWFLGIKTDVITFAFSVMLFAAKRIGYSFLFVNWFTLIFFSLSGSLFRALILMPDQILGILLAGVCCHRLLLLLSTSEMMNWKGFGPMIHPRCLTGNLLFKKVIFLIFFSQLRPDVFEYLERYVDEDGEENSLNVVYFFLVFIIVIIF